MGVEVASKVVTSVGVATEEMQPLHSRPSTSTDFDGFELATYQLSKPDPRRNTRAFACSSVPGISPPV